MFVQTDKVVWAKLLLATRKTRTRTRTKRTREMMIVFIRNYPLHDIRLRPPPPRSKKSPTLMKVQTPHKLTLV